MNRAQIERTKAEAQRFVTACDEALAAIDADIADRHRYQPQWNDGKKRPRDSMSGRASGTLRRRSMDLTRSLTDLRKP